MAFKAGLSGQGKIQIKKKTKLRLVTNPIQSKQASGTSGGSKSAAAEAAKEKRRGRRHNFFQRSESTVCLGCPPPDPFAYSLQESLPLAEQPQLLQPNARREDLFGTPKQVRSHQYVPT